MSARRVVALPLLLLLPLLLGTAWAIFDAWQDARRFVVTKDAQVAVHTAHARAAVAGQVGEVLARVGDVVQEGDVVAWVSGPEGLRVNVRAPLSGTVLGLAAVEGAAVGAGQPVVTIGDLTWERIWVVASLSPEPASRVRTGQPVQLRIVGLGGSLQGTVTDVLGPEDVPPDLGGAAAAGGGGFRIELGFGGGTATPVGRAGGGVPVRISFAPAPVGLPPLTIYPGTVAEVRITVEAE